MGKVVTATMIGGRMDGNVVSNVIGTIYRVPHYDYPKFIKTIGEDCPPPTLHVEDYFLVKKRDCFRRFKRVCKTDYALIHESLYKQK